MISRESKLKRNTPSIKVILIGGVVVLIFLLFSLTREVINDKKIDSQMVDMNKQVESLQKQNADVMGSISEWKSGYKLEKELRLKMNLKKPGEKEILVVNNSSINDTSANATSIINDKAEIIGSNIMNRLPSGNLSNPEKWWDYFFANNK